MPSLSDASTVFALTILIYCLFPLVFSGLREKCITRTKYYLICYGVNFLIHVLLNIILAGGFNSAAYIIWTGVFSALGARKMDNRGVLVEKNKSSADASDGGESSMDTVEAEMPPEEARTSGPQIRVCRMCGNRLEAGDEFCRRCGTRAAVPPASDRPAETKTDE